MADLAPEHVRRLAEAMGLSIADDDLEDLIELETLEPHEASPTPLPEGDWR
jgi:hypothetical protein